MIPVVENDACRVCAHGRVVPRVALPWSSRPAHRCANPGLTASGRYEVLVEKARSPHGPCGPEAVEMLFPGLKP